MATRKFDEVAVGNIEAAAEGLLDAMDRHGPIDLGEASKRLEAKSKDFEVGAWRRNKYRDLARIVRRAAIS